MVDKIVELSAFQAIDHSLGYLIVDDDCVVKAAKEVCQGLIYNFAILHVRL